ncbi:precorrin-3B synthase, partial [Alsobacter sp. SYSU M60028]|nr:precorrin-3B synthase [Alsobacter ponti]
MTAAERALALRKGWCPGALRPMLTGDGWLVRVRITAGIVPASLARAVASCARTYGNRLVDLSARANLQLRGVTDATLGPLTERLRELDVLDDDEAGEARRNVIASPLAGIAPDALIDIRPLVAALERALVAAETLDGLPPKFGFLVDDGGSPGLDDVACDVRFEAALGGSGEVGFRVRLGGDAASGVPAGFCTPAGLPDAAARIAAAFLALRGTGPDAAG